MSSSRLPEDEIALFTVSFSHLHYNVFQRVCEAISGYFVVLARNCLARTLDYIVMQMKKTNRGKGYWSEKDLKSLTMLRVQFANNTNKFRLSNVILFLQIP